ncbi:hypothetical protein GIB67_023581, partial [Kingdonia uniflora]
RSCFYAIGSQDATGANRTHVPGNTPSYVAVTPEEVQDVESPSRSGGDSQASVSSTDYFYPNTAAFASDTPQYKHFLNPAVENQEQGTRTTDEEGIQDDNNDDSRPRLSTGVSPQSYLGHWEGGGEALITAFAERWHLETNNFHFKWGEITITLEDVLRLIGLRVGGDMTVVQGKWGATNVKQVFKDYFYQSDQVYLDLKAGGTGISLSLAKMVDFFASKVITNAAANASSSVETPRLSSRAVAKAYMLYVLGAFIFSTKKGTGVSPKYLNFFESKNSDITWSWGAATLAHLYYSLGTYSRVNAKALACCTTLLEVVWDQYLEKRANRHVFKKVASFTSFIRSPEHIEAYYPEKVHRRFNRRQYVPRNPICLEDSGLRFAVQPGAYKPKYNWADLFSEGKWKDSLITTRGRKVHDGIPDFVEGYFECGGVGSPVRGGGVESPVGGGGGGSFLQREHFQGQNEDIISRLEEEIFNLKLENEAKQVVDSICEKDFCGSEKKLNDKNLECSSLKEFNKKLLEDVSSLKKTLAELNLQLQKKLDKCGKLASINVKLVNEVVNLQPQPLAGVWHITLKGAIEGREGDFQDPEDPTLEELGRQFTKLLAIAQEGPKGEYSDDFTLEGGSITR